MPDEQFHVDVIIDPKRGQQGIRTIDRELVRVEDRGRRVGNVLRNAFAGIASALALRQIADYADQFTQLQNRLRVVTDSQRELTRATEDLFAVADRTRSAVGGTVELYSRLSLATRDLGVSSEALLSITESVNQAIILSGASTAEAQNGLIQFSQGLASGALRGDELRSVLEQLPIVADVIAKELGVTRGALRTLGAEGAITAEVILRAFANAEDELATGFAKTVPTLGQSFTVLRNAAVQTFGGLNESIGATGAVSTGLVTLADNLDNVVRGLLAAGGAFAAIKLADFAKDTIQAVQAQRRLRAVVADGNASILAEAQATAQSTDADVQKASSALARLNAERSLVPAIAATTAATAEQAVAVRTAAVAEAERSVATARSQLTLANSLNDSTASTIAKAEASAALLAAEAALETQTQKLRTAEIQLTAANRAAALEATNNAAARSAVAAQRITAENALFAAMDRRQKAELNLAAVTARSARGTRLLASAGRGLAAAFTNIPFLITAVGTAALFSGPLLDFLRRKFSDLTDEQERAREASKSFGETLDTLPTLLDRIDTAPTVNTARQATEELVRVSEEALSQLARAELTQPINEAFEDVRRVVGKTAEDVGLETINRVLDGLGQNATTSEVAKAIDPFFNTLEGEFVKGVNTFGQTTRRLQVADVLRAEIARQGVGDVSELDFSRVIARLDQVKIFSDQARDAFTLLIDRFGQAGGPLGALRDDLAKAFESDDLQERVQGVSSAIASIESRIAEFPRGRGATVAVEAVVRDLEVLQDAFDSVGLEVAIPDPAAAIQANIRRVREVFAQEVRTLDDIPDVVARAIGPGGILRAVAGTIPSDRAGDLAEQLTTAIERAVDAAVVATNFEEPRAVLLDAILGDFDEIDILDILGLDPARLDAQAAVEPFRDALAVVRDALKDLREEAERGAGFQAIRQQLEAEARLLRVRGVEREVTEALVQAEKALGAEKATLTPVQRQEIQDLVERNQQLRVQAQLLDDLIGPEEERKARLEALATLFQNGAITTEQWLKGLSLLNDELGDTGGVDSATVAYDGLADALERAQLALERSRATPGSEGDRLTRIKEVLAAFDLNLDNATQDEVNKAARIVDIEFEIDDTNAARQAQEAAERTARAYEERFASNIAGSLVDPVRRAFQSGDFSDIGKELGRSLATALLEGFLLEPLEETLKSVIKSLISGLGGSIGGGGIFESIFGSIAASAKGNVFDRGLVKPFARGGVVTGPSVFPLGLAGEDGPEAILPLDGKNRLPVEGLGTLGLSRDASGVLRAVLDRPLGLSSDVQRFADGGFIDRGPAPRMLPIDVPSGGSRTDMRVDGLQKQFDDLAQSVQRLNRVNRGLKANDSRVGSERKQQANRRQNSFIDPVRP